MSDAKDFFQMTASEEIKFVKHNDTDFERFRRFQKLQNERFEGVAEKKEKKAIVNNLNKWDELLAERFRGGVLTKIKNPAAQEVIEIIDKDNFSSLFLKGDSGAGKTYIAYAAARRYIGMGWVTPSQIKILSEEALIGLASSGFEGKRRVEELFSNRYKLYIFDNVCSKDSYKEWELQLWEQLIDHIYSKSLAAIFTSNKTAEDFAVRLSDSGDSKFRHLVSGKIVQVNGAPRPKLDGDAPKDFKDFKGKDKDIFDAFSS